MPEIEGTNARSLAFLGRGSPPTPPVYQVITRDWEKPNNHITEFTLCLVVVSKEVLWFSTELFFKELAKINQISLMLWRTCGSRFNQKCLVNFLPNSFPYFSKAPPTGAAKVWFVKRFLLSSHTVTPFLVRAVRSPSECPAGQHSVSSCIF